MQNFTLADIQASVQILYNGSTENGEIQAAANFIQEWQHSENVFDQCFEIISLLNFDNLQEYSKICFIVIKVFQHKVRYAINTIPNATISQIIQCLIVIIKFYTEIPQLPNLQFALITLCDIISVNNLNIREFLNQIPDSQKMIFIALFFENAQEPYLKNYKTINDVVQNEYIQDTIDLLLHSPMTVEWMRIFMAIVALIPTYEIAVPLIPRLLETIPNFEMIDITIKSLANIYAGIFASFPPFFSIITQFTIAYSKKLKQTQEIYSNQSISEILQNLWFAFFSFDDDGSVLVNDENVSVFAAALTEFFESISFMSINIDDTDWLEVLDIVSKSFKSLEHSVLNNFRFPFFRLCAATIDQNLNSQNLSNMDKILNDLHSPSNDLLNEYLEKEEPKTSGVVKIAGMNIKYLDHALATKYIEYVLSGNADLEISCGFIGNVQEYYPEYLQQYLQFLLQAYPQATLQASESLFKISSKYSSEIMKTNSDPENIKNNDHFLNLLITFLKLGKNPSKANLILTILNLIIYPSSPETSSQVLNQIYSYFIQFAQFLHHDINLLPTFATFLENIMNVSHNNQMLSEFYSASSIGIIKQLNDICFIPHTEIQRYLSKLFKTMILKEWLQDFALISQYIDNNIDNGNFLECHLIDVASLLPVEMLNKVINKINEMNINEVENVPSFLLGISSIIIKFAHESPQALQLLSPLTFGNLIKFASDSNEVAFVDRAVCSALSCPLSKETCSAIFQSCIHKAYRCNYDVLTLIIDPLRGLIPHFSENEYISLFYSCLPFQDNIALYFIKTLIESKSQLDIKNATDKFVHFYTESCEKLTC